MENVRAVAQQFLSTKTWHALPAEAVFELLDSGPTGLGDSEAARRLARFGPNRFSPPARRGPLMRFLIQFHNVLIYVLRCRRGHGPAGGVGGERRHRRRRADQRAIIGYVRKATPNELWRPSATCSRSRRERCVAASGGRCRLRTWCRETSSCCSPAKVPADAGLFEAKNLRVQQAHDSGVRAPVGGCGRSHIERVPAIDRAAARPIARQPLHWQRLASERGLVQHRRARRNHTVDRTVNALVMFEAVYLLNCRLSNAPSRRARDPRAPSPQAGYGDALPATVPILSGDGPVSGGHTSRTHREIVHLVGVYSRMLEDLPSQGTDPALCGASCSAWRPSCGCIAPRRTRSTIPLPLRPELGMFAFDQ